MNKTIFDLKNSNKKPINDNQVLQRIEELSNTIEDLNLLCKELDPYQPLDKETTDKLSTYGIFEIDNPFMITNKLVFMLENSVEELISLGGTP
jgi:hypothetical protein